MRYNKFLSELRKCCFPSLGRDKVDRHSVSMMNSSMRGKKLTISSGADHLTKKGCVFSGSSNICATWGTMRTRVAFMTSLAEALSFEAVVIALQRGDYAFMTRSRWWVFWLSWSYVETLKTCLDCSHSSRRNVHLGLEDINPRLLNQRILVGSAYRGSLLTNPLQMTESLFMT